MAINNDYPSAQAFTTGSSSAGYTLTSVTLSLSHNHSGSILLSPQLYSDASDSPGTSLATLSSERVPFGPNLTNQVFTCNNGCQLTSGTTYHVVVIPARQYPVYWGQSNSGNQTNTPSNAGWTIADDAKYRNGQGGSWLGEGAVKLMKVSWATPTAPGKVAGLTAAAGNLASVDLNWTAVTGATGYKVQYKSGSQDWSSTRQVSSLTNSHNLDKNLVTANTAHTFRVAATNAVGDGAWSDEVVATPVEATLRASGVEASTATLTIANHTGTWYHKRITPTAGTCSTGVSTTSTSASGLSPGLTHTFSAYADSQCTGTALATTPQFLTKPGKASGVSATAANGTLDVIWTATTGASSYKVQWKSSSDSGWDATNRQTTSTTASANISSLTNGTTYTVRVAAVNDTGDGAWSDTATGTPSGSTLRLVTAAGNGGVFAISGHTGTWYSKVTPPANATCETNASTGKTVTGKSSGTGYTLTAYSDSSCNTKLTSLDFTTLPAKVAGVTATARNTSLGVSWTVETGSAAVSYKVLWKSGPQNWDATNREVTTTKTSATLTGLTNDTAYTIRVAATTAGGDGAWSDPANGTPSATALTLAVTPADNGALFSLSNHTGSFYYKVTPPSNANCVDGSTITGTPRNFVDYTKSSGTDHNITVYSDAACSTVLTSVDFITLPAKTTGVTLSNQGASLGVSWTAVTGAASYKVQWKSSADTGWDAANRQTTSTTTSATIPSLTNGTTYTVRVAAVNASGDGAWSDTATETPTVTLTAGNITSTGATLTVAGHTGTAYLSARGSGNISLACTAASGATHSPTLQGNTTYEFKAYSSSSCTGTALASTSFTTPGAVTLFADNIKQKSVMLYLEGWETLPNAPVSYIVHKAGSSQSHRRCGVFRSPRLVSHLDYGSLEPGTTYTAQYFRGNRCAAIERFASVTFTTLSEAASPELSVSNVTDTGATLTLANHTGNWWYEDEDVADSCAAVTGGATTVHLSGLTANTNYGFTAWSHEGCADATTPSLWYSKKVFTTTGPLTVAVSDKTSTGLTVNLRGYTEANGFPAQWSVQVVRPDGGGFTGSACQTLPRATTSATVTGLEAGKSYTIEINKGSHCSNLGNIVNQTPVTTVSMAVGNVGPSSATLTLGSHEGAWSYQGGEASGQGAGAFGASGTGQCQSLPAGTYTAELDNLNSDTDYAYTAHFGGNCAGGQLAGTSFTTPPLTAPAAPSELAAATGDASATLTWSDPSDASITGYEYQVNHNATESGKLTGWGDWTAIDDSSSDTTSHVVNGLTNGREYRFRLRAQNEAGAGAKAPVADPWYVSVTPQVAAEPGEAPEAPASVAVTRADGALNVSWPTVAGATSYHVTYTSDNGTSWSLAAENHPENSITITGVDNALTYIVGVRAKNAAGSSGWTNSAPAATLASPEAVASVTAVHQGSSLAVSWPAAARADSYHVTYSGNNGTSWQLGALEHSGTSLTISGVDSSKTYIVGVRAKNAGGASGWVNSAPAAPPALSVADATAAEPGAGGTTTLDFVVSLNRAASGTVTVDHATSDGTATAGADYTAASGTLSFAVGETSKTVSVPVLNDAHDEGSETLTLTLSNATGAVIGDGEATGTITNAGPMPQAWISRFGRTVADQVLDAVATRLRSEPTPGMEVTLAGERLRWSADADAGQPVAEQAVEQLAQWLVVGNGESGHVALRTIQGRELVANSSFAFASPSSGGSLFSFWGRGAVTSFEGREGELSLDGEVTTWLLGTDWSWGQVPSGETRRSTAGLLLSRSRADGGYDNPAGGTSGDVAATLTGVFPWGSHRFTDWLAVWGTVGYGQGELDVTPKLPDRDKDGATLTTDLNLWLAAAGLRGTLLDGGNDGLTITGTTDAMVVGNTSERVTGLEAAQATVTRWRLGVEAQRPITLGKPKSGTEEGSGAVLTPSLELGLRHDGGDAETGFGLDLGGGIVLSHPQRGLQAELRGRGLLSHAAEGFRDQGFSGSLSWQQQPDSDLGAALSLSQTMGGSSSGGADALLSRVTLEGLAANDGDDDLNNQRLELQLSYGFPAFGDRFTLTPELGLGLYDSGRDYRIGWRLTRLVETGAFDLSFDVTRREGTNNDGTAPDHGVQLEWNTRF